MKKSKKIVIFSSLGAMLIGVLIGVSALGGIGFNFANLSTEHYRTHDNYPISEPFHDIEIETVGGNVLVRSGSSPKVVCSISEHITYDVKSEGGTLKIKQQDNRPWYGFFNAWNPEYGVVVELPAETYERLLVKTTSGDVWVKERYFLRTEVATMSGDITLLEGSYGNLKATTTSGQIWCPHNPQLTSLEMGSISGDIILAEVQSSGPAAISTVSGDIGLSCFDASEIRASSVSGNIGAALMSGKIFSAHSTSGYIHVPDSDPSGGTCDITTTSGNIEIDIWEDPSEPQTQSQPSE